MFKSYLILAWRTILKKKAYSFINIAGLTTGIAVFTLIALFVQDELSYDSNHEKSSRIYRIGVDAEVNGNKFLAVTSCQPMSQGLIKEFSEVEASTRLRKFGDPVVRYKNKTFSEEKWFYTEQSWFDIFTVPFLEGDSKTALSKPNNVVITRTIAQKYFGSENPIGKILNTDNRRDYLVTGVIEDVPKNSHVHYDFLASLNTVVKSRSQNWIGGNNFHTYFLLREGIAASDFEIKVQSLIEKYIHPQVNGALGITPDEFYTSGGKFSYFVQPLTDIHLHSHFQFEHETNGNIIYVYIFSTIAIAILLIACINFINLATAKSAERAKEVGIRKTVGSNRNQIFRQFISESILISFISVIFALIVVEILLPYFNTFTGKELDVPYINSILTIPVALLTALFVGILAGFYPALYIASFNPLFILQNMNSSTNHKNILRNSLVVIQFSVSIILIIGTLVVYGQMQFIQTKQLGFERDQLVVIKKTDDLGRHIGSFKHELLRNPAISNATNVTNLMGDFLGDDLYRAADSPSDERQLIWRLWADEDFIKTFQMTMVSGRYFTNELSNERRNVVLNETAVKTLGMKNPVGTTIVSMDGRDFTVIGVVKDFHYESLHKKIMPLVINAQNPEGAGRFLVVRTETNRLNAIIDDIKQTWHKFAGRQALEYEFFDDHFAKVYLAEIKTGHIFLLFSLFAILIASLGLFGLASFVTAQRTKEIGIRKVLGATIPGIMSMFFKQFTKWVLISNIIAWPIAYYAMSSWLQNFQYKTEFSIWTFIISGVITLIIAVITVSYQSFRGAIANPVESLKYE